MLNNYVNYCAVKIQKVFRGYLARKLDLQFVLALGGPEGVNKLEAVMVGWRTRRILRLKEAKTKIRTIKDHDALDLEDMDMDLKVSRSNTCLKLIQFVNSLERDGQWIMMVRDNIKPKPINRNLH